MIESYKKYVLISLLANGRVAPLPKYTSGTAQHHFQNNYAPYREFANSYSTSSPEELHKTASKHAEVFQKDGNFGLVKQCIKSLYKKNIQRLTKTHLTLSISDMSKMIHLSTKETEAAILNMIDDGEIFATIHQQNGMVSFHDNTENYRTNETSNYMDNKIQRMVGLACKIHRTDESISSSTEYLQKLLTQQQISRFGMGVDFDEFDGDKPPFGALGGLAGLMGLGNLRS
eukprot:TRINITY_DN3289_c0_g1_i1.p1 TRINITY_DN3289_c0_g1~~TRINITY_DN3289_c0_g1_i1.p1  ORF type:complete len:230 (-),score=51.41 TRINITY_DN3289_c0_g1_i1:137-826(-)